MTRLWHTVDVPNFDIVHMAYMAARVLLLCVVCVYSVRRRGCYRNAQAGLA